LPSGRSSRGRALAQPTAPRRPSAPAMAKRKACWWPYHQRPLAATTKRTKARGGGPSRRLERISIISSDTGGLRVGLEHACMHALHAWRRSCFVWLVRYCMLLSDTDYHVYRFHHYFIFFIHKITMQILEGKKQVL
jgi:hypothetical protein